MLFPWGHILVVIFYGKYIWIPYPSCPYVFVVPICAVMHEWGPGFSPQHGKAKQTNTNPNACTCKRNKQDPSFHEMTFWCKRQDHQWGGGTSCLFSTDKSMWGRKSKPGTLGAHGWCCDLMEGSDWKMSLKRRHAVKISGSLGTHSTDHRKRLRGHWCTQEGRVWMWSWNLVPYGWNSGERERESEEQQEPDHPALHVVLSLPFYFFYLWDLCIFHAREVRSGLQLQTSSAPC